jgi:prepilin-type N-terminal cleavage/methylation domain-containing protein
MSRRKGFSLVETMVALALLGVIVVTVLGSFSTVTLAVRRHTTATSLDRLVRSDAEYVKSQAYATKPGTYATLTAAGYTFAVQILYYDPASGTFATTNADNGLQQIVLTVTATAGGSEQLRFLKVQP